MKRIITTLLGMLAVTGLVVSGSDADDFLVQLLASTGGVMLFSAAMLSIASINRRK